MRPSRRPLGVLLAGCALLALPGCGGTASSAPSPAAAPRVAILGGGSSHDFPQWFQRADSTILASAGARVAYAGEPAGMLPVLREADVLYQTANQPLNDPALREAIMAHVRAGKGLIVGHAGSWYNWRDWPEYNRQLIGGGARAHRRYGDFEVKVVRPDHPVMQGVPATFNIRDELYRIIPDTAGAKMEVLATAREVETGTVYPIIYTVQNPSARIVVNTLGHDGEAHNHPAYQRILQNSLRWAGGRNR